MSCSITVGVATIIGATIVDSFDIKSFILSNEFVISSRFIFTDDPTVEIALVYSIIIKKFRCNYNGTF